MSQDPRPLTTKRRVSPAIPGSTVQVESPTSSSGLRYRHPKSKAPDSKPSPRRNISKINEQRDVSQDDRPGSAAVQKDSEESVEGSASQVSGDENPVGLGRN